MERGAQLGTVADLGAPRRPSRVGRAGGPAHRPQQRRTPRRDRGGHGDGEPRRPLRRLRPARHGGRQAAEARRARRPARRERLHARAARRRAAHARERTLAGHGQLPQPARGRGHRGPAGAAGAGHRRGGRRGGGAAVCAGLPYAVVRGLGRHAVRVLWPVADPRERSGGVLLRDRPCAARRCRGLPRGDGVAVDRLDSVPRRRRARACGRGAHLHRGRPRQHADRIHRGRAARPAAPGREPLVAAARRHRAVVPPGRRVVRRRARRGSVACPLAARRRLAVARRGRRAPPAHRRGAHAPGPCVGGDAPGAARVPLARRHGDGRGGPAGRAALHARRRFDSSTTTPLGALARRTPAAGTRCRCCRSR